MLKSETIEIAQIYVPAKRRSTVDSELVRSIAESILEIGQQTPVLVRPDSGRYVLVDGLHRLEACKALGEHTIVAFSVSARASTPTVKTAYETDLDVVRQRTERLRQLRLAKEAAERVNEIEKPIAREIPRGTERRALARPSKKELLLDWLAERERDGYIS